jgi:hypothetical protein
MQTWEQVKVSLHIYAVGKQRLAEGRNANSGTG